MKTPILITAACALALLSTVGAALPYPILPPLFAGGADNALVHFWGLPPKLLFGLALTINPLGLLIGTALMGPMSDNFGRRPVLLLTAIGAAIGHAITALSLVQQSYPLFILARFVTGLLEGNGAVARALLADKLEGDLRVRALSWLSGAFYMGWFAGPLLAGITIAWGLTVPFWFAAAALLLTAVLVALALPPETGAPAVHTWWHVARQRHALNLLRHRDLRHFFILQFAYTCGVTAFYEFYPLWLVEFAGYGTRGISGITALLCGVMTITSVFFAGKATVRAPLDRARLFAIGTALAIGLVAVGNTWLGLAAIVLFGIPNAFYNPIIQAWCADHFGSHGNGAVMGLISTTFCFANIVMALAGSVLTLVDTRLILLLGACLTAWSAWRLRAWHRSDAERTAIEEPRS